MPKICYWRGAIGEQELLELHGKTIQELIDGTYASGDLERLEGHRDIFSYRVSGSGRLLFTTINKEGARYLLLLEYLPTHDYQKSKFLRSKVLSRYLMNHEEELTVAELQFNSVDAPLPALENLARCDEQDIPMECYDGLFIHLNTTQEEALRVTFPAVISGPAGSGKSCVAMSLLSAYLRQNVDTDLNEGEITKILYVSESNPLVRSMERSWHELHVSTDLPTNVHVGFLTYEELLNEQGALQDKTVVGRADFEGWYEEYKKKQRRLKKAGRSEFLEPDSDTAYQEFRICSVSGYAELGERDSSLPKGEARKLLEEAYTAYMQSLRDRHAIHPAFHRIEDENVNPCHMILVDEAQAFSRLQLENLVRLAQHRRVAFFMDSHQALSDVKSVRPFLLNLLRNQTKKEVSHIELAEGYRCPLNITRAANQIILFKHQLTGGLADKAEVGFIAPHVTENADTDHVIVIDEDTLHQWTWLREQAKGAHCAVITAPEYVKAASELFPKDRVFTYEEIKGLQYDTVIVFHPFVKELFKRAFHELTENTDVRAAAAYHRPKAGKGDDTFTIPFNELFIAFTRAKKRLVICSEQGGRETAFYLHPLKAIMGNTRLSEVEQVQSTTEQDWHNEIKRQVVNGQKERAFSIFCTIYKPGSDARKAFDEKYIKPATPIVSNPTPIALPHRSVTSPAAPQLSESPETHKKESRLTKIQKSPALAPRPLSKEEEHVLALLKDFSEQRLLAVASVYGLKKICFEISVTFDEQEGMLFFHIMNSREKTQLFARYTLNNFGLLLTLPIKPIASFFKKSPLKQLAQKTILSDLIKTVDDMTKKYPDMVHKSPSAGFTASCVAAMHGNVQLLVKLNEIGADLNKPLNTGETPAYISAQIGHVEILKALKDLGADIHRPSKTGATPAHVVSEMGNIEVLRTLKDLGADLNWQTIDGRTPAYIAAEKGKIEVLRVLKDLGADFLIPKHTGSAPAHVAAEMGNIEVLRTLKDLGVNLNTQRQDGATPAFMAAYNDHVATLKALYDLGADLNQPKKDGATPAHIAVQDGHTAVIKTLGDLGADLNRRMADGITPAYIATHNGHLAALKILSDFGADLNIPTNIGVSPAYIAAYDGELEIVLFLLEKNTDFTKSFITTNDLFMNLAREVTPANPKIVERMNKKITQRMGLGDPSNAIALLPIDIAEVMGHENIVKLLRLKRSQEHLHAHSVFVCDPDLTASIEQKARQLLDGFIH